MRPQTAPARAPPQATHTVARYNDPDDPDQVTFIDLEAEDAMTAWITADTDAVVPLGGERP